MKKLIYLSVLLLSCLVYSSYAGEKDKPTKSVQELMIEKDEEVNKQAKLVRDIIMEGRDLRSEMLKKSILYKGGKLTDEEYLKLLLAYGEKIDTLEARLDTEVCKLANLLNEYIDLLISTIPTDSLLKPEEERH